MFDEYDSTNSVTTQKSSVAQSTVLTTRSDLAGRENFVPYVDHERPPSVDASSRAESSMAAQVDASTQSTDASRFVDVIGTGLGGRAPTGAATGTNIAETMTADAHSRTFVAAPTGRDTSRP